MIKRTGKSKKSKQGSILIIVVLILALAMIFISSAMMLTQATKDRLYGNAMSSQARLTVTAASEVFLEALETQEITDAQLEMLLNGVNYKTSPEPKVGQHGRDDCIKMVISGVPGMGGTDGNCTYLDLYYPNASDLTIINADFTTVIGDETENVQIVLKYKDEEAGHTGRFKNQIDVNGDVSTSQVRFIGGVGEVNPALGDVDDNTILFRGDAYEQTSNAVFFSDIIFADGAKSSFGGGNKYYGSMIFLDNAYLCPSGGTPTLCDGDFYFIGKNQHDAGIRYSSGGSAANFWSCIGENSSFIFSGREGQNKNEDEGNDQNGKIADILQDRDCYFVDKEDTVVANSSAKYSSYDVDNLAATSGLDDTRKHKLEVYKMYDYSQATEPYPDDIVEDVFLSYNADGKVKTITAGTVLEYDEYGTDGVLYAGSTSYPEDIEVFEHPITPEYPEYAKESGNIPTTKKIDLGNLSGDVINLSAGYYYIEGSTTAATSADPLKIITIDGSKGSQYRFYFSPGQHIMRNIIFAVYNVSTENPQPVIFVLEPTASLVFGDANLRNGNWLCNCGFISMNRGCTSGTQIANYIKSTKIGQIESAGGEEKVWDDTKVEKVEGGVDICYHYSKFYDGIAKPSIFIFGSNCNFQIGDNMVVEAYVGLYEDSTWAQNNNISNNQENKIAIYGRIEADQFANGDNPTGYLQMPYCPAPGLTDPLPAQRPAVTKYHVINVVYYYDHPEDV